MSSRYQYIVIGSWDELGALMTFVTEMIFRRIWFIIKSRLSRLTANRHCFEYMPSLAVPCHRGDVLVNLQGILESNNIHAL